VLVPPVPRYSPPSLWYEPRFHSRISFFLLPRSPPQYFMIHPDSPPVPGFYLIRTILFNLNLFLMTACRADRCCWFGSPGFTLFIVTVFQQLSVVPSSDAIFVSSPFSGLRQQLCLCLPSFQDHFFFLRIPVPSIRVPLLLFLPGRLGIFFVPIGFLSFLSSFNPNIFILLLPDVCLSFSPAFRNPSVTEWSGRLHSPWQRFLSFDFSVFFYVSTLVPFSYLSRVVLVIPFFRSSCLVRFLFPFFDC